MASSMDAENDEFVLAVLHFVWFQLLLPAIICLGFSSRIFHACNLSAHVVLTVCELWRIGADYLILI